MEGGNRCRAGCQTHDATPEAERQEIRDIYAAKGFTGELLDRVVGTITANRETCRLTTSGMRFAN